MMHDLIRAVADALADGTTGVNTLLSSVPKESGVAVPPTVTVYDASRTDWVGRGRISTEEVAAGPLLLVSARGDTEILLDQPESIVRAPLDVIIRYAMQGQASDTAALQAWQTLRAALRCALKVSGTTEVWPKRNGTWIDAPRRAQFVTLFDHTDGDTLVVGALILTFFALDPWALNLE